MTHKYLTIVEAAERLRVNHLILRTWISEGKLKAYDVKGGSTLIREDELDAMIKPLTPEGRAYEALFVKEEQLRRIERIRRSDILEQVEREIGEIEERFRNGFYTDEEWHSRVVDVYRRATSELLSIEDKERK